MRLVKRLHHKIAYFVKLCILNISSLIVNHLSSFYQHYDEYKLFSYYK